jgi:hypothetical protein
VRPIKLVLLGPRDPTSLRCSLKIITFFLSHVAVFFALGFTVAFFLGTAFTNFALALAFFLASFLASFSTFSYSFTSFLIFDYRDLSAFSAASFSFCTTVAAFSASLADFSTCAFSDFATWKSLTACILEGL